METKMLTTLAVLVLAAMMGGPVSGLVPIIQTGSQSENNSWVTDGAGTWRTEYTNDAYANNECSWIETSLPLPNTMLVPDPHMTFDYAYDIELSVFSGFAYDASALFVSTDAGATWIPVATGVENSPSYSSAIRNCVDATGGSQPDAVISGTGAGTAMVDLSTVVVPGGAGTFQVRLLLASDACCVRDGWTVSNAVLAGVPIF